MPAAIRRALPAFTIAALTRPKNARRSIYGPITSRRRLLKAATPTSDRRGEGSGMPSKKIKRTGELESTIRKPIRPQVNRPRGYAIDPETVETANAEMVGLETDAVEKARHEKLQLLLCRYELADNDWYGLALRLANSHEPGFRVESQLATLWLCQ